MRSRRPASATPTGSTCRMASSLWFWLTRPGHSLCSSTEKAKVDRPPSITPAVSLAAIAAVPVADWAAPRNRWLFLWATTPMLPQVLGSMRAWGFSYSSSAFCSVKQNPSGCGFHTGPGFTTRQKMSNCACSESAGGDQFGHTTYAN